MSLGSQIRQHVKVTIEATLTTAPKPVVYDFELDDLDTDLVEKAFASPDDPNFTHCWSIGLGNGSSIENKRSKDFAKGRAITYQLRCWFSYLPTSQNETDFEQILLDAGKAVLEHNFKTAGQPPVTVNGQGPLIWRISRIQVNSGLIRKAETDLTFESFNF